VRRSSQNTGLRTARSFMGASRCASIDKEIREKHLAERNVTPLKQVDEI